MPFCPKCGIDNPETARYCDQCGAALIPVAGQSQPAAPATPAPVPVAGPVTCPQCGTSALPGEAFCDNCGAPLGAPPRPVASVPTPPYQSGLPQQPRYPPPQPVGGQAVPPIVHQSPTPIQAPPPAPAPTLPRATPPYTPTVPAAPTRTSLAPARLIVVSSGAVLPLPAAAEAVIGRADPVSRFFPEVDLTPHGALEQGVGRRHLRLFVQNNQILVEDLDSTNGTMLNGHKLSPRQVLPLNDGDQLLLGRLALQIRW